MKGKTYSTLTEILEDVLCQRPSQVASNELFRKCHRLASAYLRRRSQAGRLDLSLFGISMEDLALDCVAELFRRDKDGRFVQFDSYFASPASKKSDDEGLEIALRRIVFSAVNEGLFRRYRELDPSLGRIIRTIKRRAVNGGPLKLDRGGNSQVLRLKDAREDGRKRPRIPQDILEIHLHHALSGDVSVGEVLRIVARVLESEEQYASSVSVTEVALAMRSVMTRLHAVEDEVDRDPEVEYAMKDLSHIVRGHVDECTDDVMESMESLYVQERGISPTLFRAYFRTAHDVMIMNYVDAAAPKESLRVALCKHIGETTSTVYRKQHQAVLEYVVKLTQRQLLSRVSALV